MNQEEIRSYLMSQIAEVSSKIREMEEYAKTCGLDIDRDVVYTSLKGQRYGLTEALREIKR